MKKLIPLLLAVLFTFAIAIPSLAAEGEYHYYNNFYASTYVYEDEETYADLRDMASDGAKLLLVSHLGGFERMYVTYDEPTVSLDGNNDAYSFEGAVLVLTYNKNEGYWTPSEMHEGYSIPTTFLPVWSTYDVYRTDGTIRVYADYVFLGIACDGSACPAADVNHDGICDDCGMTFAVGFTGRDIAYDLIYDSYERFASYPYAVIIQFDSGTYRGYLSDEPIYVDDSSGDESQYALRYSSDGKHIMVAFDGLTPTTFTETTHLADGKIVDYSQFISANYNLSGSSGETFDTYNPNFRSPLWWMTQQTTQGGMMSLFPEVVGTMKILVLCGVGCLALLVVLKLFGKRSLIYRN